jgi:nucleoid DNA-binding protein
MTYEDFVTKIAIVSGHPVEMVRDILFVVPDVLISLPQAENVRTPLGVFRMTTRSARSITPPSGGEPVPIPAEQVIKLKAGTRLRKDA